LQVDFIQARDCKLICERFLTLPSAGSGSQHRTKYTAYGVMLGKEKSGHAVERDR